MCIKAKTVAVAYIAALAIVGGASAFGQNVGAITERRALLKEIGEAMHPVGPMLKREQPFDLAAAHRALDVIARNYTRLHGLFPEDSRTGAEHFSRPAVWERKEEYDAMWVRGAALASAARAAVTDEASFRERMPAVVATCGECHRNFRIRVEGQR